MMTEFVTEQAFAAGLVLLQLVEMAREIVARITHWQYSRSMAPLWRTLVTAFPHIAINTNTTRRGLPSKAPPNFYRCIIEISDGLALLGPYYPRDIEQTGTAEWDTDPATAAAMVRVALAAYEVGALPSPPPYPRLGPGCDDWRLTARWMTLLARSLPPDSGFKPSRDRSRSGPAPPGSGLRTWPSDSRCNCARCHRRGRAARRSP